MRKSPISLSVLAVADDVSPLLYDHLDPRRWQGIDCIVSCGDLPPDYLDFLGTMLGAPVFYVRGNHDGAYPESDYDVGQDLHGRIVEYRGVRMAGFEGCRRYNHGCPQYTEREMRGFVRRERIAAFRRGAPDLVVSHAPPARIHDGEDLCHRGFESFNRLIEVWKPAFFIHGHTHAYDRKPTVTVVGCTTIINAFPYYRFEVPERVPESRQLQAPRTVPSGVDVTEQPRGASS
jgi:predicted phosphodiesterase